MLIAIIAVFFFVSVIVFKRVYTAKHSEQPYKTSVAYSNAHFIIVDKQPDFKINSNEKSENTVQTFLKSKFPDLVNKDLYHEFYFPHRLDFATSGLLCIPKTKEACKAVSNAFSSRSSRKYYIALVRGWLSKDLIDISASVGEDGREPEIQKMCTLNDAVHCQNPRPSQTIITVLQQGFFANYPSTKVLCRPITGRRHQIRVHCCSIGHTIIGDYTYSSRKDIAPSRMFLHSLRLILPNKMSDIDVSTRDPFRQNKEWKVFKIVNSLDLAYKKIDNYVNGVNLTKVF